MWWIVWLCIVYISTKAPSPITGWDFHYYGEKDLSVVLRCVAVIVVVTRGILYYMEKST